MLKRIDVDEHLVLLWCPYQLPLMKRSEGFCVFSWFLVAVCSCSYQHVHLQHPACLNFETEILRSFVCVYVGMCVSQYKVKTLMGECAFCWLADSFQTQSVSHATWSAGWFDCHCFLNNVLVKCCFRPPFNRFLKACHCGLRQQCILNLFTTKKQYEGRQNNCGISSNAEIKLRILEMKKITIISRLYLKMGILMKCSDVLFNLVACCSVMLRYNE